MGHKIPMTIVFLYLSSYESVNSQPMKNPLLCLGAHAHRRHMVVCWCFCLSVILSFCLLLG